jgi:C-terminal processing protease CtpA/Prc
MKLHKFRIGTIALLIVISFTVLFYSCSSVDPLPEPDDKTANEYIYEKFQNWYLWYDQIPNINPNKYETEDSLINSIIVKQDKWSFSASLTNVRKLLEGGKQTLFGGGMVIDGQQRIRVTHVYANSPFDRAGVQRGWEVKSVDGYMSDDLENINRVLATQETLTFGFIDREGHAQTSTLTREEITLNTVLYATVFTLNQYKIGYFVFDSFLGTSSTELDSVFARFKREGINELIVDLRYNGGGLNDIAYNLTAMIGGNRVNEQIISSLIHNTKQSKYNSSKRSNYKGVSLELNRVFFITTNGTASASELVINSLTPFIEVQLVGSPTHGKPVGMYVFEVEKLDLAILPISFKTINSLGYGDYFEGLPVTIDEADDLDHNWGDPEEAMLKSALNAITQPTTAYRHSTLKSMNALLIKPMDYKGINKLIGAY